MVSSHKSIKNKLKKHSDRWKKDMQVETTGSRTIASTPGQSTPLPGQLPVGKLPPKDNTPLLTPIRGQLPPRTKTLLVVVIVFLNSCIIRRVIIFFIFPELICKTILVRVWKKPYIVQIYLNAYKGSMCTFRLTSSIGFEISKSRYNM